MEYDYEWIMKKGPSLTEDNTGWISMSVLKLEEQVAV